MFTAVFLTIAITSAPADILQSLHDAATAGMPEFQVEYVDCRLMLEALSPENALVLTSMEEFRQRVAAAQR